MFGFKKWSCGIRAISSLADSVKHSTTGRPVSTDLVSPAFTAFDVTVCRSVAMPRAANTRMNAVEQPVPELEKNILVRYRSEYRIMFLTVFPEFARLIIPRQQIMVLRPIALRHQEDHVRIGRLEPFVQSPNEMRWIDQPRHVHHDQIAQRQCHKQRRLNGIIPIL